MYKDFSEIMPQEQMSENTSSKAIEKKWCESSISNPNQWLVYIF